MRRVVSGTRRMSPQLGLMIVGLLGSYFTMLQGSTPSETAGRVAWMVAATLVVSMGLEVRSNWKVVLRPDVISLAALFFLTLFEFLFPQPRFDSLAVESSTIAGIVLCLIAFGSIAIFRHFAPPMPGILVTIVTRPTPPKVMLGIFWFSFFFGFFYMLLAVRFNVATLIDQMIGARFSQPWSRGRYGNWKALLNELGMILYLVPPIAGVILANREKYKPATLIAIFVALLFTFFQGFASGTRYVLAAYVATFLVGYSMTLMNHRRLERGDNATPAACQLRAVTQHGVPSSFNDKRGVGVPPAAPRGQSDSCPADPIGAGCRQ
jgi:hypothetical protein